MTPARPATRADSLPRALVRLMLATEDAYGEASREVGLTAQQAQLLCLARGSASIGELAGAMRCDRSNISRMVDRAGSRGLLARRAAPGDARVSVVELTGDGRRLMERFIETLDRRIAERVGGWPSRRRAEALAILNDLAGALEAGAAPVPEPAAAGPAPSLLRGL